MNLSEYNRKRDFEHTPEPTGGHATSQKLIFVIQKHAASTLHYDFRLELDGVLKSWAVPKGPSTDPSVKRLAMKVEDHPYDYRDFEGTIAEGNYGAGTVIVWDKGTYETIEPLPDKKTQERSLCKQLENGSIKIRLHGKKLHGEFALVRTQMAKNSWLLIKHDDKYASTADITEQGRSVMTGKTLEEQKAADRRHVNVYQGQDAGKSKAAQDNRTLTKQSMDGSQAKGQKAKSELQSQPAEADDTESRRQPFPQTMAPMLATLSEPFDQKGWLYEIKWDGYRALGLMHGNKVNLVSRNQKSFNKKYRVVYEALKAWGLNAVVDGEIVAINAAGHPDFNALQNWENGHESQLAYYVFDLLWLDGFDLTQMPLEQRRQLLFERMPESAVIRFSGNFHASATELLHSVNQLGLEGIIAKKSGSAYYPGQRSEEWLKMKTQHRQEVVIGGYTRLHDSPKPFSSLLAGVFEQGKFRYIGKIGTGFSHAAQQEMLKKFKPLVRETNPFELIPEQQKPTHFRAKPRGVTVTFLQPKLVCEVKFAEFTPDGIMRHPAFVAMRDDKPARQVVAEKAKDVKKSSAKKSSGSKGTNPEKPSNLLPPDESSLSITIGSDLLKFTNLDKVYWPEDNITKRDLLNYYDSVAPYILPYLNGRPMSLHRHPNGYAGASFYQKDIKDSAPEWATTLPYHSEQEAGVDKEFLVCTGKTTLLYMANLGCIEMNPWNSTVKHPEHPDWCVLDLDPPKKMDFEQVIEVAQAAHEILEAANIPAFCKTSGSTGLHIYIPLHVKYTHDQSQEFAELIAKMVQSRLPKLTSMERDISKRKGKLYLDFLQNKTQATLAAPYSVRPKPQAPVSMPLQWHEVKSGLRITDFTLRNSLPLIEARGDIFKGVLGKGIDMQAALNALEAVWDK